ncbi:hypothetical protein PMIN01_00666 [Paraphaeosphaeria minitans]|uniref:FAS1 domain-containing protein n=1 Tax=Paraphaeosphaeria minitans TaxID=565426 RepID=A0A9P6KW58_9PLEO|nr:hypothetical protein PMIN01_00666 [Paraphaeosphaeria minitans]
MRTSNWSYALMAAGLPEHVARAVSLVPGFADTLAAATNVTIVAPTNAALVAVPRNVPEGEAIEQKSDTIAIGALLANHVFKGLYPSDVITDVPTFAQTLLNSSYIIPRQPFSKFTGEQTISTVTQADIKLGHGITIHKIDTVLSFGPPLQLYTYRAGYLAMNAALEVADLGIGIGLTGADDNGLNISDFTIFIPMNDAFSSIGSVLETTDKNTLQQGDNLTFTVLPDGSAWVNNAKITFANAILVLSPGNFDRASLKPSVPVSERTAFPSASAVPISELPFSSIAFQGDRETYTKTPALLQTAIAVPTSTSGAATTGAATGTQSTPTPTGEAEFLGAAKKLFPHAVVAFPVAIGAAAALL